jgi:hypothetical protein
MALRDTEHVLGRTDAEQREQIQSLIRQAGESYKNDYLGKAKQYLNATRLALLSNYETTNSNWEQERLFKQIAPKNKRGMYCLLFQENP